MNEVMHNPAERLEPTDLGSQEIEGLRRRLAAAEHNLSELGTLALELKPKILDERKNGLTEANRRISELYEDIVTSQNYLTEPSSTNLGRQGYTELVLKIENSIKSLDDELKGYSEN